MTNAQVVQGRTEPWETVGSIKVECLTCGVEWGWSQDVRGSGNFDKLQGYADKHNGEVHDG